MDQPKPELTEEQARQLARQQTRRATANITALLLIFGVLLFVLDRRFSAATAGWIDIFFGVVWGGFALATIRRRGGFRQSFYRPALFFYLLAGVYLVAVGYGLLTQPPAPTATVGNLAVLLIFLFGVSLDLYIFFRRIVHMNQQARLAAEQTEQQSAD